MTDALGSYTQTAAITKISIKQDEVASSELKYVQSDAVAQGIASDIQHTKAGINSAEATIENPPTIPVTESSKKGSKTTHQVNENAVRQAERQLARLEADLSTYEADLVKAQQETSTAEQDMLTSQAEFEEANSKLSTLSEAEDIASKLLDVYQGEDGFLNKDMEDASIERLGELVEVISEWGDIDGNGTNDGENYAKTIDAFLNDENGFYDTAGAREYESDYIARGEVPPWQQVSSSNRLKSQVNDYVQVDVVGSGETRNSIRNEVIKSGNNAASNGLDV